MQNRDPLDADPTLANRFLTHQLSQAERALVEAELRSNPDFIDDLEAAARFKIGLQKLREAGELDSLLVPRHTRRPSPLRGLAFAVAAMALVVVGAVLVRLAAAPVMIAASIEELAPGQAASLPLSRTYSVMRRRTLADRVSIQRPATRQALKLRILPQPEIQPPYRISIATVEAQAGAAPLGTAVVESADGDGLVTVFVDSARLAPGSYVLVISQAAGSAAARGATLMDSYLLEVGAE